MPDCEEIDDIKMQQDADAKHFEINVTNNREKLSKIEALLDKVFTIHMNATIIHADNVEELNERVSALTESLRTLEEKLTYHSDYHTDNIEPGIREKFELYSEKIKALEETQEKISNLVDLEFEMFKDGSDKRPNAIQRRIEALEEMKKSYYNHNHKEAWGDTRAIEQLRSALLYMVNMHIKWGKSLDRELDKKDLKWMAKLKKLRTMIEPEAAETSGGVVDTLNEEDSVVPGSLNATKSSPDSRAAEPTIDKEFHSLLWDLSKGVIEGKTPIMFLNRILGYIKKNYIPRAEVAVSIDKLKKHWQELYKEYVEGSAERHLIVVFIENLNRLKEM